MLVGGCALPDGIDTKTWRLGQPAIEGMAMAWRGRLATWAWRPSGNRSTSLPGFQDLAVVRTRAGADLLVSRNPRRGPRRATAEFTGLTAAPLVWALVGGKSCRTRNHSSGGTGFALAELVRAQDQDEDARRTTREILFGALCGAWLNGRTWWFEAFAGASITVPPSSAAGRT